MNQTDAVVPDARDGAMHGLPQIPFSHTSISNGFPVFGSKAFDSAVARLPSAAPGYSPGSLLPHNNAALVPQLAPHQYARLTASQQAELELARRRAQKAAEGKRANATAARRAKRKAQQRAEAGSDRDEDDPGVVQPPETEAHQTDSDIEAKLATVEDQKEAKRLKRLLRNRVSAQQARERKKSYVSDLEGRCKGQEQQIGQLEQRIKVLERENVMLRQVIKNMQGNSGDTRNGLHRES